jgi:hypothetical protein
MSIVDWKRASWFVVFPGIADAYLWGFDVQGRWRLGHDNPARSTLGIIPLRRRGRAATFGEAVWIADCIAYDHDAPIAVFPSASNARTSFPHKPVVGMPADGAWWYFNDLLPAFYAAAEIRFGESYSIRYELSEDHPPSTDFGTRFGGREDLIRLYAMAARQADLLSEYLCLYRVLEARDGSNGIAFAEANLPAIRTQDFGVLRVYRTPDDWTNAFEVYRQRAKRELRRLRRRGVVTPREVASHLYAIRNSLAHGRYSTRVVDFDANVREVSRALPLLKLVARLAVSD